MWSCCPYCPPFPDAPYRRRSRSSVAPLGETGVASANRAPCARRLARRSRPVRRNALPQATADRQGSPRRGPRYPHMYPHINASNATSVRPARALLWLQPLRPSLSSLRPSDAQSNAPRRRGAHGETSGPDGTLRPSRSAGAGWGRISAGRVDCRGQVPARF